MKNLRTTTLAIALLLAIGCRDDQMAQKEFPATSITSHMPAENLLMRAGKESRQTVNSVSSVSQKVLLYKVEYLTSGKGTQAGNTIIFSDRGNKQMGDDFVSTQSLDGSTNLTYHIDSTRPSADLASAVTSNAIIRAMKTWDDVKCSKIGILKVSSRQSSTGYISRLLGYGGSFNYIADVNHAGWLPKSFFDAIAANGGEFILGATFTIVFADERGNPIDSNRDNKADVAWREIYYNDNFTWTDGSGFDVESIALHESGHGLSQAHFGKAFLSGNGKLHFAPRAVMNAAYSGAQTTIGKTDLGGHCSIWASWPNK